MNERKLIAIGVDRDGRMWGGHFGIAPQYYLYDRSGNLVEKRSNPYGAGGGKHKHHDNPNLIVDLLPECGVFIARRMGDGSKQELVEKFGIQVVLTESKNPQSALTAYFQSTA